MLKQIQNGESRASTPGDSIRNLQNQKSQLANQFREYQQLSQREIERLESQRFEVESAISSAHSMLEELT